jgi:hypothetical protein
LFAADGAAAILLAEEGVKQGAKETKHLAMLPWVSVYYLHRKEEDILKLALFRAMHSASMRMGFDMPRHDPLALTLPA